MSRPWRIIIGVVLLSGATRGVAEAYIGASAGVSDYDGTVFQIDIDNDETGWKVFGGYHFNDHFGAEAAWVDPGDANDDGATLETDGFVLQGVGRLPIGARFALMGKVGAFFWEQSARYGSFREDRNGTDLAWGIGGSYGFLENRLRVRLEWEEYDSDIDVGMLSLGVGYHFR